MHRFFSGFVFIKTACLFYSSTVFATSNASYLSNALNATDVLDQQWYNETSGLYQQLWWNTGAILPTIGDLALLDGDFYNTASDIFANTLRTAKAYNNGSFLNKFYDDEGWWAMAWIKAYDLTKDVSYLETARDIFEDLLTGNNATCGGHWWSKDRQYNAAIANELYLAVAASLANREDDGTVYQNYAQAEIDWFLASDLIDENYTIHDGLNSTTCERAGPVFSYNQGVILGALVEMEALTSNRSYLDIATSIAKGAMAQLATPNNGILTELGYPNDEDPTESQFKGVFVRNLMYLHAVMPDNEYVSFFQTQADSIWTNNRQNDWKFGALWQGPIKDVSAAAHGSALAAIVAAATYV